MRKRVLYVGNTCAYVGNVVNVYDNATSEGRSRLCNWACCILYLDLFTGGRLMCFRGGVVGAYYVHGRLQHIREKE